MTRADLDDDSSHQFLLSLCILKIETVPPQKLSEPLPIHPTGLAWSLSPGTDFTLATDLPGLPGCGSWHNSRSSSRFDFMLYMNCLKGCLQGKAHPRRSHMFRRLWRLMGMLTRLDIADGASSRLLASGG